MKTDSRHINIISTESGFHFLSRYKLFLKFVVDEFVFLADSPLHIALLLSRGGESIAEFYIFSAFH